MPHPARHRNPHQPVKHGIGRVFILGRTHGQPTWLRPEYAHAAIDAVGTCPGFDATLNAIARRRYLATAPISAVVTVAFGSCCHTNSGTSASSRTAPASRYCPAAATCPWPTTPRTVTPLNTQTAACSAGRQLSPAASQPINSGR
jgi:hypothetical protein